MERPVLPDGADGGGIQITLARTPSAGVKGEESVDEGAELWNVVGPTMELLMTEPGAVEEAIDNSNAVVPRFYEKIGGGEGGHG